MSLSNRKVLAITMGDPAGVGAEVIAKAIRRLNLPNVKFLLIGDSWVFSKFLKRLPKNCDFLDLNNVSKTGFQFGKISKSNGKAAIDYLNLAVSLIKKKEIDALITAPISKEAVSLAGFKFPGHTEFLADSFNVKNYVMMFVAGSLRVSLVTRHIPLKDVASKINQKNIYETICTSAQYLKKHFKIRNPKIAICGLNPHAGDGGILGIEEETIIKPSIKRAQKQYKNIFGPYPSDTLFSPAIKGKFDCVIAMYHDQAMIPVKTICFDRVVNLTLGLPFIRTSPAHGTAFDIAGKDIADAGSMVEAIKLASKLT